MTLYKYLRPDRTDVLEKLQIRFSPAISTNDAFELKPLIKGLAPPEQAREILAQRLRAFLLRADTPEKMLQLAIARHPEAESSFRAVMKAAGPERWLRVMKSLIETQFEAEVTSMRESLEATWPEISKSLEEVFGTQLGILSLTEDPTNPVMWGHYSDSSRGFVVGFDDQHPWFNQKRSEQDDFCHLRKVAYSKRDGAKFIVDLTAEDVVYSKLDGWSYEKEWRVVFPLVHGITTNILDSFGQPVIVFPFPEDIITEVIIGSRASEELSQRIRRACEKLPHQVPISIGRW